MRFAAGGDERKKGVQAKLYDTVLLELKREGRGGWGGLRGAVVL